MGEKLIKYYKYIKDIAGYEGMIDLATKTKIPSTKAALVEDTDENIKKFKAAIKKITGTSAPEDQNS